MKLSMWLLYDWLKPLGATAEIQGGAQVLRNARHFTDAERMDRLNVYVGEDADSHDPRGDVFCAHGHDLIRVPVGDVDLVFNEVLRAFDFYNGWAEALREKVHAGCALSELLNESDAVFDDPLSMLDAGYATVAVSERFARQRSFDENWVQLSRDGHMSMQFIRSINDAVLPHMRDTEPFLLPTEEKRCLCQNLYLHNRLVGWIALLSDRHPLTRGREQLLHTLGGIIEEWLRLNEDSSRVLEDMEFIRQLIKGEACSRLEVEHRFNVMGWSPAEPKVVVKVAAAGTNMNICEPLCTMLSSLLAESMTLVYQEAVVVLANLRVKTLDTLKSELLPCLLSAGVPAGLSYVFTDMTLLNRHYQQAEIALQYGDQAAGALNLCHESAVRYAVDVLKNSLAVDMIHPDILLLRDYDARHGTEFCETLRVYLLSERSQSRTAERMCLHRNTLYYRLTRIEELIQANLDEPDTRMHMLLSFQLA